MEMTPLVIEICLHYYWSPEDYADIDSPATQKTIMELVELGILIKNTRSIGSEYPLYSGNKDALEVYVSELKKVLLPVNKWVLPEKTSFPPYEFYAVNPNQ